MAEKLWQSLYSDFLTTTTEAASSISSSMSGTLTVPLTAAMTTYLIVYGWAIIRGSIQEPLMDFLFRAMKLFVIWTLVVQAGSYTTWVGSTITEGLPEFVDQLTGGGSGNALPSDSIFAKTNSVAQDVLEFYAQKGGMSSRVAGPIYYFFTMAAGVLLSAIAFGFSLLVTLGFTLLAAIGPLFISFALFNFSRGWFFSWLGQLVNFAIYKVLLYVMAIVILAMLENALTANSKLGVVIGLFYFLGIVATSFFLFFLLPSMASALSAGAGASTGMVQRAVERRLGIPTSSSSSYEGSATRSG